jgi:tRNA A37 threonylcarbamoyladenosine synthetase subunit TsaC/SUA5/YrdC
MSPATAGDVLREFGDRIELILDGGQTPGGMPSTVVDATGNGLKIIRQGAIKI